MAILHDDDPRFKGLEKKTGFFMIVALLGIVLTVVAIGVQQDFFASKTRLYFITDSGQDIAEGMAVKLSGFIIGKVEKLELTNEARVKVTISIIRKYMKWVRLDSKARLQKEGVIGASIIEISPGTASAEPLADQGPIAFERQPGTWQLASSIYDEIMPLIEDVKRVVRRADEVFSELPATQKKLDDVLTGASKSIQNLEKLTSSDLPVLTRSGRETLEGAKRVVDSMSRTWPLSNKIKQPQPEVLPVDSYDDSRNQKQ